MIEADSKTAHEYTGAAGPRGPKVRSDCWIGVEPTASGGFELEVSSTVEPYYGEAIRELVLEGAAKLGLEHARIRVEDGGAYPFALMARLEAAVRRTGHSIGGAWMPEQHPDARTSSARDRRRRSRLYLPGDQPKLFVNAGLHRPDGVILDLEDSVAPSDKDAARVVVRNALHTVDFMGAERMVRINQGELGLEDLRELVPHGGVHLVLMPKVEDPEEVRTVDRLLSELGDEQIALMPILESARGVLAAQAIAAASGRNVALTIGLEDYTADLGIAKTDAGSESLWARSMVVHAARAAGLQAIDSVYSDFADEVGLLASVREAKSIGFEGKGCIHPRQIADRARRPSRRRGDRNRQGLQAWCSPSKRAEKPRA